MLVKEHNSIELLKWLGLFSMLCDHINKYLFNYSIPFLYEIGRLAMPLFGLVLAYNLARFEFTNATYLRLMKRLLAFAVIATPFFIYLGGVKYNWWPLNILFTLFTSVLVVYLLDGKRYIHSIIVFIFLGALVEFWWPAIALVVSAFLYFRKGDTSYLILIVLSAIGLCYINGNFYALLAFPIFYYFQYLNIVVTRTKWLFYCIYPLQFIAFILIRIEMSKHGYIFLI